MEGPPLHRAARAGQLDEVRRLVEAGADVNSLADWPTSRPLHWAIMGEPVNLDVLSYLVEHGARIGGQGRDQGTPLHLAALRNDLPVVKRLVELGADVNAKEEKGQGTPLHWALQGGQAALDVLSYLVEHGSDVNAKNVGLLTPLHFASITGNVPATQRLLDLGADLTAENVENQTPVHMARGKVKDFFKELERKVNAKGLAMVSVSKQLPYDLTRKIGQNLDINPKTLTPQSAKGRKTRARKTKRRLTRRRK